MVNQPHILQVEFGKGPGERRLDLRAHNIFATKKRCKHIGEVHLTDVVFIANGELVGLDDTEYLEAPNATLGNAPISFEGVWDIPCTNCLSDVGKRIVNGMLAYRCRKLGQPTRTLDAYFPKENKSKTIRICVLAPRTELAQFLTAKKYPNDLVLHSRRINFIVDDLHVETYQRSRRFLRRWQLMTFLRTIGEHIPIDQKTPEGIMQLYLDLDTSHASKRVSSTSRYIYDARLENEHSADGVIKSKRRNRWLNHAEIAGVFGSEAEWLLAVQLQASNSSTSKNLLHLPSWYRFCKTLRRARKLAKNDSLPLWGRTNENDDDPTDDDDDELGFERFGGTKAYWHKKFEILRKGRPQQDPEYGSFVNSSHVNYDDQFSSADEENTSTDEGTDTNVYVPSYITQAPPDPDHNGKWFCPAPGCPYSIDLLNLTPSQLDALHGVAFPVPFIRQGGETWKFDPMAPSVGPDRGRFEGKLRTYVESIRIHRSLFRRSLNVQFAFFKMVEDHYHTKHMNSTRR